MDQDNIHVKDSVRDTLPLCAFDAKDATMGWTTRESARKIATCGECLRDVIRDECSLCNGHGSFTDFGEEFACLNCDLSAAQDIIDFRRAPVQGGE